ncbi:MAG: hypothetical protein MR966_15765 [Lachnospiraceae bacterium]|nr:hypothetical protein [Lachnospiraceae bacterium]
MPKIKNKRELDRLLKSHTAAEISQMIQNGGLDFDQDKYSITEYEEMGKYAASYTAEYEKQLQQISQQVLGRQNRVDELLSDGYMYAGNHKERINFDHSLLLTGVSPEVVIHAFQKDGKVREILTSGQECLSMTREEAKEREQLFEKEMDGKMRDGIRFAEITGYAVSDCVPLFVQMEGRVDPLEPFAAEYKSMIQEMVGHVAGSALWNIGREGADTQSNDLKQELFAADKTHIIRAMMELSAYDAQGHSPLADTLGYASTANVSVWRDANIHFMRTEVCSHLDSIEHYRSYVEEIPYGNMELIAQITGTGQQIMDLIIEQGNARDVKAYLTQTIPFVNSWEEVQPETVVKKCPDAAAELFYEEAVKSRMEGHGNFENTERRNFMPTLGAIHHDAQLTEPEKEILSRAFLQKQFSGRSYQNHELNHLLHMKTERKLDRAMELLVADTKSREKILGRIFAEKIAEIEKQVQAEPGLRPAEIRQRFQESLREERIGELVSLHLQEDGVTPAMDIRFRGKTMQFDLSPDTGAVILEANEQEMERARDWMDELRFSPDVHAGSQKLLQEDGMTAQEADRYHGNHAFRLSIEVPQIGHPYETTASLNMTREQILAYNFDRAACRYQPGQDVSACNFKLDYASYEFIEAASEPKNPELNKTGIMAARVVTKGAHENRELLAESYRPVAGLEQRNRNDRIRRIDGQVSENLMEETLKFLEMDAGDVPGNPVGYAETVSVLHADGSMSEEQVTVSGNQATAEVMVSTSLDRTERVIGISSSLQSTMDREQASIRDAVQVYQKSGREVAEYIRGQEEKDLSMRAVLSMLHETRIETRDDAFAIRNVLADMDTKLKCSSRFREVETPVTALVLRHETGYLAANEENKALLCVKPDHGQETCEVWPHSAEEMEELLEGLKRSDREADQRAYACLARYAVSEREKIPYEAVSQEEIQSAETQEWEIDTEAPSL